MHPGRFPPAVFLPAALLACFLVSGATVSALAQDGDPEGTVKSLEPGVLLLNAAGTRPCRARTSGALGPGDLLLGPVPKEEVTPGCRVLVWCAQAGPERKALMVRVIRGRAQ